jgi:hypothetical protein
LSDNRAGNGLNNGGGAISCFGSSARFEDCSFLRNSVFGDESVGGGLNMFGGGMNHIIRCHFEENSVDSGTPGAQAGGGAVFHMDGANASFEDCTFLRNRSTNGEAGGVFSFFNTTSTFRRCSIRSQVAHTGGGAVIQGNAQWIECEFIDNHAVFGGGLQASVTQGTLDRCTFIGNSAEAEGGGMRLALASPTVVGCLFVRNTAAIGGALMLFRADVRVESLTLHGNSAGIQVSRPDAPFPSTLTMDRSIVSGSLPGQAISCAPSGSATVTCSNLFGNQSGDWIDCVAGQSGVNGNQSADPLYCMPEFDDFRIGSGSPCAPANSPAGCGLVGAFEVGCGATAVIPATWGQVKAHYR